MKPKVSSMWGESGSVWICEDRVTEQSPEPDLQQCFKVLGTESHNSYQYMESHPEQFSCGESQDLSRTAETESQDLDLEPESQLLFVKKKFELVSINGKDYNFVEVISIISFFKFSVRPYHKQFPWGQKVRVSLKKKTI